MKDDTLNTHNNALGKKSDSIGFQKLMEGLSNRESTVRRESETALVAAGEEAVPHLIHRIAAESDPDIRWYAARVLARIGRLAAQPLLDALRAEHREDVRRYYAAALAEMMDPPIQEVLQLFNEQDPSLRGYGTLILCRIGEAAIGPLKESLNEANGLFRRCAEYTLLRIHADPRGRDDQYFSP